MPGLRSQTASADVTALAVTLHGHGYGPRTPAVTVMTQSVAVAVVACYGVLHREMGDHSMHNVLSR